MDKPGTMFGKLLTRVHNARHYSRLQAQNELWRRNGLEKAEKREGYKIAETKEMHRDGTEVVEYRLYKLIDASVVTLSSEVKSEVVTGIKALRENSQK